MSDHEIAKRMQHALAHGEDITCTNCKRDFRPYAGIYGLMCPFCKGGQVFSPGRAADLEPAIKPLTDENKMLRDLLFIRHGCSGAALYGDDGERQCQVCGIDFKRDTVQQIEGRWVQISIDKLAAAAKEKDLVQATGMTVPECKHGREGYCKTCKDESR